MVDIHEILNGPRPYQHFRLHEPSPGDPDEPETLENLKETALGYYLNGPEGNEMVLRLMEIIEALQAENARLAAALGEKPVDNM